MSKTKAGRACQPVTAQLKNQERRKTTSDGSLVQVVRNGECIGVLVAGPHGFLAFGACALAALVQHGGVHKDWRAAIAAMGGAR